MPSARSGRYHVLRINAMYVLLSKSLAIWSTVNYATDRRVTAVPPSVLPLISREMKQ